MPKPLHPRKSEFIRLFHKSGWSQAEIARKLDLTRGGVNGIITGSTVPSEATLKHFRLTLLLEGKPEAATDQTLREGSAAQLQARLDALPPNERAEVLEMFNVLVAQAAKRVSYKAPPKKPGANRPEPDAAGD